MKNNIISQIKAMPDVRIVHTAYVLEANDLKQLAADYKAAVKALEHLAHLAYARRVLKTIRTQIEGEK